MQLFLKQAGWRRWLPVIMCAVLCPVTAAAATRNAPPLPFDSYYGLYIKGQKVGYMRAQLQLQPQPQLIAELHAQVAGMGQVAEIDMRETRQYAAAAPVWAGQLKKIFFTQRAATGSVTVKGWRRADGKLQLEVQAGGATQRQNFEVHESLGDALATTRLAREARLGASLTAEHFESSLQQVLRVEHRITELKPRNLAGVTSQTVQIASNSYAPPADPNSGIRESGWFDAAGTMLEAHMGGIFVARLEPPEIAKRLDQAQDLLVSAVVPVPQPLAAPQAVQQLRLTLQGLDDFLPPASPRQQVERTPAGVQVLLRRDVTPRAVPLLAPAARSTGAAEAAEIRAARQPTAFIQSDAPELKQAAKQAIGQSSDVFAAATKLTHFVYKHMHSEYVPAYSNALEAFHSARGDCTEHSVLYVALARAVNIPARVAVGMAYWPPGDGFGWHAWAEIYVDGRWLAVDPTWDQPIADATHLKLADGGPAEQARIVMLLGQLKITAMQSSS